MATSGTDEFMTTARCADIRHRFERERNALLEAKQRETESKLKQEIDGACERFAEKTGNLKDWIVAAESMNQKRWEQSEELNRERWNKMDDRIWGLYILVGGLVIAILLAIYFKIDVSGMM